MSAPAPATPVVENAAATGNPAKVAKTASGMTTGKVVLIACIVSVCILLILAAIGHYQTTKAGKS